MMRNGARLTPPRPMATPDQARNAGYSALPPPVKLTSCRQFRFGRLLVSEGRTTNTLDSAAPECVPERH